MEGDGGGKKKMEERDEKKDDHEMGGRTLRVFSTRLSTG